MSSLILSLEEILENVFKFLSIRELNKLVVVCSKWKNLIYKLKKKRIQLFWSFYDLKNHDFGHIQIKKQLLNVSSQPCFAIHFINTGLYKKHPIRISKHNHSMNIAKFKKILYVDYINEFLPIDCYHLQIINNGIVGTSFDCKTIKEFENSNSASFILFPIRDDIKIFHFEYENEILTDFPPDTRLKHEDVKLILLFVRSDDNVNVNSIASSYKTVVAGGYVDEFSVHLNSQEHINNNTGSLALAFCGSTLSVSSIVLEEACNTYEKVDAKLRQLYKETRGLNILCAFIFSCCGRGKAFYNGKNDLESGIFKKIYGNVPLIGYFGNGEIGFDYFDLMQNRNLFYSDNLKKLNTNHTYTSVFVILALKVI